jgi:hypothetical protein
MSEKQIKAAWESLKPNRVDKAIAEVKVLMSEIKQRKMKIAELALSVCVKDGRKYSAMAEKPEDVITLADFAEKAGLVYGTLMDWVASYEYGAKAINPRRPSSVPYKEARRVAKVSKLNAKPGNANTVKPKAAKINSLRDIEVYSSTYLSYTAKFSAMLKTQKAAGIPKGVKTELRIKLKQILKALGD